MIECLPPDTVERRRAEIAEWIAPEAALYLSFASNYWADFAEQYTLDQG